MLIVSAAVVAMTIALPSQGQPTFKPMSETDLNAKLSASANRPKPIAFLNLYVLGVLRLQNESASIALRRPSSVDGYGQGYAEMVGLRGGRNTANEAQSTIDLRFHTNKANITHALVIPIGRAAQDVQQATFEIRIGSNTIRRSLTGSGTLMATWTPQAAGYQGLSIKMASAGKFTISQVSVKYASE